MECPHCHKSHPDTDKFCAETGKPLTLKCPNTECEGNRNPLPINNRFCPHCGASLHAKEQTESDGKINAEKKSPISQPDERVQTSQISIHNNSTDDEDGCFSTAWKIITGIFAFLGGLYFWFQMFKSCN